MLRSRKERGSTKMNLRNCVGWRESENKIKSLIKKNWIQVKHLKTFNNFNSLFYSLKTNIKSHKYFYKRKNEYENYLK